MDIENEELSQDAEKAFLIDNTRFREFTAVKNALEILRVYVIPVASPRMFDNFLEIEHHLLKRYKDGVTIPSGEMVNGWDNLTDEEKDKEIEKWRDFEEGDEWKRLLK
jgi:hypothetical protein